MVSVDEPAAVRRARVLRAVGDKLAARRRLVARGVPRADTRRDGAVSFAEFRAPAKLGVKVSADEVAGMLGAYDAAGDGRLGFDEFAQFMIDQQDGDDGDDGDGEADDAADESAAAATASVDAAERGRARVGRRRAQRRAARARGGRARAREEVTPSRRSAPDRDGSVTVDAAELAEAVASLGLAVSAERMAALVDAFDLDGTGRLRCCEFARMVAESAPAAREAEADDAARRAPARARPRRSARRRRRRPRPPRRADGGARGERDTAELRADLAGLLDSAGAGRTRAATATRARCSKSCRTSSSARSA